MSYYRKEKQMKYCHTNLQREKLLTYSKITKIEKLSDILVGLE